ncbi:MAG TPA: RHS repeat-associated core domain-containing protein, partial [Ktedonobacterales bacterium]|nr:RHS repeat-associated core domain-containing protein [Ktedonobacterales bacterium]
MAPRRLLGLAPAGAVRAGASRCGGTNTAGTLSAASYTQTFAYDNLGRLTSGPLGNYGYADAAHLHGATSIGGQWTGTYDASGDLTCRAPSSATTCAGTPTGAQLSYDAEGRLSAWQNAPSSPSSTDSFLYDGEGHRVQQVVTSGGATTTTVYIGRLEEVATSGATITTTTYYYAGGKRIAEAVNGTFSYLCSDMLGSALVALAANGIMQASELYIHYGNPRYTSGTMPGSYGFTGQRADGATGLDYYNARYYDPLAGQFAAADTDLGGGLNRFAYVGDNPVTRTDPSGHHMVLGGDTQATGITPAQDAALLYYLAMSGATASAYGGMPLALALYLHYPKLWAAMNIFSSTLDARDPLRATTGLQALKWRMSHPETAAQQDADMQTDPEAYARLFAGAQWGLYALGFGAEGTLGEGLGDLGVCSFRADTPVATPTGEQAIGSLKAGDQVTAYDPATGKPSTQTVQHVWINHDNDLLDVTLHQDGQPAQTDAPSKTRQVATKAHGSQAPPSAETIHTTEKHPWLTVDRGWMKAVDLHIGEHVVELGGRTATITALRTRPGEADYYNLTVSVLHTYAVGSLQAVVHNTGCPSGFDSDAASQSG